MDAKIRCPLTPPPDGSSLAALSPNTFRQTYQVLTKITRRGGNKMTLSDAKRFKLSPPEKKEEGTMKAYMKRVLSNRDINTLHVSAPMDVFTDQAKIREMELGQQIEDCKAAHKKDIRGKNTLIKIVKNHKAEMKNQMEDHETKMDNQIKDHKTKMDNQMENHTTEMKNLVESHKTKMDKQMEDHKTEIKNLVESHKIDIQTLLKGFRAEINGLNTKIEGLEAENAELKKEIVDLKAENVELKKEIVDLKAEKVELKKEIVDLKAENVELKKEIVDLKDLRELDQIKIGELENKIDGLNERLQREGKDRVDEEKLRIEACGANLLTKCLDKLPRPNLEAGSNLATHSTNRYHNQLKGLKEKSFKEITHCSSECFKTLMSYPDLIEKRNVWAHETHESFAMLLMKEEHMEAKGKWEKLFRFGYGETVEEVTANVQARLAVP